MTKEEMLRAIVNEYNKHSDAYDNSTDLYEMAFHATMCNGISAAVTNSDNQELKDYFVQHAKD